MKNPDYGLGHPTVQEMIERGIIDPAILTEIDDIACRMHMAWTDLATMARRGPGIEWLHPAEWLKKYPKDFVVREVILRMLRRMQRTDSGLLIDK